LTTSAIVTAALAISLEGNFTTWTAGAHEKRLPHMFCISGLMGAGECLSDLLKIVT
jgi:hypothetical protein